MQFSAAEGRSLLPLVEPTSRSTRTTAIIAGLDQIYKPSLEADAVVIR